MLIDKNVLQDYLTYYYKSELILFKKYVISGNEIHILWILSTPTTNPFISTLILSINEYNYFIRCKKFKKLLNDNR